MASPIETQAEQQSPEKLLLAEVKQPEKQNYRSASLSSQYLEERKMEETELDPAKLDSIVAGAGHSTITESKPELMIDPTLSPRGKVQEDHTFRANETTNELKSPKEATAPPAALAPPEEPEAGVEESATQLVDLE